MTETQNVATYARIRPYNPAINEDKKLTARAVGGNKILNQNGDNEDTYNFTKVFDMTDSTNTVFEETMKPLLDFKILQGITSIFIVYGQSGSGKSFTLIGEKGHLGVLPMSLQYLLQQDSVEHIHISSIEAYGINQAKIGFYDLVAQLKHRQELESKKKKYDAYSCKDNPRLNPRNAESLQVTKENCLEIITKLQDVSHMAPTLKNPHSSRGHTVYFNRVKMRDLEDVYFICIDLAGSEGQTALGTKEEFTEGLRLAMSKGKLHLSKKQMKGAEQMYKTRSLEAGCINNGLTQLQSIFGELIRKKISKSQGLGLRKILHSFVNLKTAYAIMFTTSASANNNKVTRATLNFAKQTQLVKVDTQKAKKKIDKDKMIKELEAVIKQLKEEMNEKNLTIIDLQKQLKAAQTAQSAPSPATAADKNESAEFETNSAVVDEEAESIASAGGGSHAAHHETMYSVAFEKYDELSKVLEEAKQEEEKWSLKEELLDNTDSIHLPHEEMKSIFDELDEDGGGTIDSHELHTAMKRMGQELSLQEVNNLIERIDEDGDGQIDFEEFKVMVGESWFVDAFQNRLAAAMLHALQTENDKLHGNLLVFEHENEELNASSSSLLSEVEQWKNMVSRLESENEELRSISNSHEAEMEALQRKISELEQENDGLRETRTFGDELKSETETPGDSKDIEALTLEEEEKEMEVGASLQQKINELERENDELRETQKHGDDMKSDVEVLKVEVQLLRKNVEQIERDKVSTSEEESILSKEWWTKQQEKFKQRVEIIQPTEKKSKQGEVRAFEEVAVDSCIVQ